MNNRCKLSACGLISLVAVSAFVLLSCAAYADTTNITTLTVIVPDTCAFSSGGGTYNGSYDPNTSNVVTGNNIVTSCNDGSGYAIYAVGYSNDSYTGTNTDLIHSTNTNYNIKTDGSGNYNSSWKMKVTSVSNATIAGSFNNFQNIPSSFTKIASYTTNTTEGIITPSYQINIGNAQPAGVYTGKVKYVLVHPNTMMPANSVYTIAYNANGGSGTMNSETGLYNFEEHTLPSSGFTAPSGYQFAGWCTTNTSQYACSDGTSYAAGASVDGLASAGGTVTLYAYWEEMSKIYMQDQTSSTLAALMPNVGDTATLYDKRDEKSYTVAHLADGNYWMTQNLDHDIKTDGSVTYDSTTTDIPSAWAPSTATYATGSTTWNYSTIAPESYDPGDLCWNGILDGNWETTLSNGATACGDDKHYHIGNYYNWTAAVAMNDSSSYTARNTDVNQSICPAGWRLPIGGTSNTGSKSFQYLVDQLSLTSGTPAGNIQNSPVYFVYGGYWSGSSNAIGGSCGSYWSSVLYDSYYAYYLYFDVNGTLGSQGTDDLGYGDSVRCVAR